MIPTPSEEEPEDDLERERATGEILEILYRANRHAAILALFLSGWIGFWVGFTVGHLL